MVSGNASRILKDLTSIDEDADILYDLIASVDDLVPDSHIKEITNCIDRVRCGIESLGRGLNIRKEWVVQEEDKSDADALQAMINAANEYTRESDRQMEEERKERESDPYMPNNLEEARAMAIKFRGARTILSDDLWKLLRNTYQAKVDDLDQVMEEEEIKEDVLHRTAFEKAVLELIAEGIITGKEIIGRITEII